MLSTSSCSGRTMGFRRRDAPSTLYRPSRGRGTSMPFNNIGPMELVIVLVIALIVIGPKRLPEVGKSLGRGMREFKDSLSGDSRDDDDDVTPPLRQAK